MSPWADEAVDGSRLDKKPGFAPSGPHRHLSGTMLHFFAAFLGDNYQSARSECFSLIPMFSRQSAVCRVRRVLRNGFFSLNVTVTKAAKLF